MARNSIAIDGARFWSTIEASAEIGKGPRGGLARLTLSPADGEVRDLFAGWCTDAGYALNVDKLGNMFARRRGTHDNLPPVVIGSHLDTQAAGGRFDGIVGVLAGLEILRALDDQGIETRRPIEVVNWTNEEGGRFPPPMLCSGVFAGLYELDWALGRTDEDGTTVADALNAIGYAGDAPVGGREFDSYFEIHIEQGPALYEAGIKLGLVTGTYFARGMRIEVEGVNAHSGPTPMDRRRNAIVGAASVALEVDRIGLKYADREAKSTVARLEAWPNKPGIISDRATLFVDFRSPEKDLTETMEAEIRHALVDCAQRSRTDVAVGDAWSFNTPVFDAGLQDLIREAAAGQGVELMELRSQAGHDAYNIAKIAPSVLIFTPCDEGISHNEAENTSLEDQLPGIQVLAEAVVARANR
ncbi:Zn-dependent hydrolase [Thalassobaculum sp. OXR-137]|uniref:Zn-dependent hydrolase n=1 Tax=Thalassobaculum sp. OXR-137 TaxID=3100173 RepID=UPI002AC92BE6|nr:Zn-dependent hydrolase [Thalassobaculum sp. OXR-137]WPZ36999.1 Zn-dependent hydrolase [Thalassobaculum sp. OXR-137]